MREILRLKLILLVILMLQMSACTRLNSGKKILFSDDFSEVLNTKKWVSEIEAMPNSSVYTHKNRLVLDTKGGVTVWFNRVLSDNYEISFKRKVIVADGKNDRLSDLNVFWLAHNLDNSNLFTRNGKFEEYDSLNMYYVGMGGNNNTTIRFRKYEANTERKLLAERNEAKYLLKPNYDYQIKIIVKENMTSFWVDNELLFQTTDQHFQKQSYFGFRSTFSHQEIWDFKVSR